MTPDLSEEGEALMPPKRSRWCRALLQLLGFAGEEPPRMAHAATEAAQVEAAFFASYRNESSS